MSTNNLNYVSKAERLYIDTLIERMSDKQQMFFIAQYSVRSRSPLSRTIAIWLIFMLMGTPGLLNITDARDAAIKIGYSIFLLILIYFLSRRSVAKHNISVAEDLFFEIKNKADMIEDFNEICKDDKDI